MIPRHGRQGSEAWQAVVIAFVFVVFVVIVFVVVVFVVVVFVVIVFVVIIFVVVVFIIIDFWQSFGIMMSSETASLYSIAGESFHVFCLKVKVSHT